MCGLVGLIGKPGLSMAEMFRDLVQINTLRGKDSAGYVAVNRQSFQIGHALGTGYALTDSEDFEKWIMEPKEARKNYCLIGHNRAATKGEVTLKNAHPFTHEHITLAHNGTVWNTRPLVFDGQTFDTDSEQICYAIAHKGPEWTWKRIQGAAALTWWDDKQKSLNVLRNDKRPLDMCWIEDQQAMMWASEGWMMEAVAKRNKVDIDDEGKMYYFAQNRWYTYRWNAKKRKVTLQSKEVEANVPFTYGSQTQTYLPGFSPQSNSRGTGGTGKGGSISLLPHSSNNTLVMKNMGKEEFNKRYQNCFFCKEDLKDHYSDSVIVDGGIAICPTCTGKAAVAHLPLNVLQQKN